MSPLQTVSLLLALSAALSIAFSAGLLARPPVLASLRRS